MKVLVILMIIEAIIIGLVYLAVRPKTGKDSYWEMYNIFILGGVIVLSVFVDISYCAISFTHGFVMDILVSR
jgi:multisubunit Na+/H+ antiporter MnhB subunit